MLAEFSLLLLLALYRNLDLPRMPFLFRGFGLLLVAYIATVAEGFVLPQALNLIEHICYAAAGVCFVLGCRSLRAATALREPDQ